MHLSLFSVDVFIYEIKYIAAFFLLIFVTKILKYVAINIGSNDALEIFIKFLSNFTFH